MVKTIIIAVVSVIAGAAAAGLPLYMQLNDANNQIQSLETDKTALIQQVETLEGDLDSANNTITGLNNDLTALQADYQATSDELDNTKTTLETKLDELTTANSQIENLNEDLAAANQNIEKLTSDLSTANSQIDSLNGELSTANLNIDNLTTELSEIEAKYPLKDFSDYNELSAWVRLNTQPYSTSYDTWFSHALKVQEEAANDGYYVSAFVFPGEDSLLVINCALAGNTLYVWDPEDTAIYEWWEGGR